MFLALRLLTLLFLVVCFFLGPGLSDAPASPPSALLIGGSIVLLILVFLGLDRFAPPWLSKGFTLLAFCVTLIGPGVFLGLLLTTQSEMREQQKAREALVRQVTTPGHTHELSLYLLARAGDTTKTARMATAKDIEQIEHYVLSLPPEELRANHVTESLLLGIQVQTDPRLTDPFEPLTDALCRLYPKLKERSGFSVANAPLILRYQDRRVSRIAELGWARWVEEIGHEHPVFQGKGIMNPSLFDDHLFFEQVPKPLAPGEHLVSRSLGSLPMYVVMTMYQDQFPAPPGLAPPPEDSTDGAYFRGLAMKGIRDALAILKAQGVDFTEEELRDPELQTLLETLRTAPPPTP